jgi:AraC family transcriptional regulator
MAETASNLRTDFPARESPAENLAEYSRRFNQVLDYIDRHLDTPLNLAELAALAHFSPFHFHRIFTAWMGETPGDYLRRRRLETAAMMLAAHPPQSVLSVALSVGFGSGEAFSRAFKLHFSCTPTAWRRDTKKRWISQLELMKDRRLQRNSNPDQVLRKQGQEAAGESAHNGHSNQPCMEIGMDVRIVDLPAAKVAYMRYIGPYGPGIGEFWRKVFHPWIRASGLEGRTRYGIAHDDPSITPAEKCRCDTCVEVAEDFVPTGNALLATLPGGRYAVAKFHGTPFDIADAWTEMFRDWLPSSGMQCDSRPCFERFAAETRKDPETGVLECEICIPVRPL